MKTPQLSVVVACHNNGPELDECLAALARAAFPLLECVVVNDGSTDSTAQVLRRAPLPVKRIHFPKRRGAPVARNAGARAATGEILVFLDADVCVHADTLSLIAQAFAADAGLGAVFGSYDDRPAAPGFHSQYRNLLHCYVHRTGRRKACTFWTGCGAVRREIFFEHGGFVEPPGSIDDVEFGWRLFRGGTRIELRPEIKVQHLKRWTFLSTVKTDIWLRGVPWTRLVLREKNMPDTLNLGYRNRVSVVLVWLAVALAVFSLAGGLRAAPLAIAAGLAAAAFWLHRDLYAFFRSCCGTWFAVEATAAHFLHLFNCGLAFAIGCALFARESLLPRSRSAAAEAPRSAESLPPPSRSPVADAPRPAAALLESRDRKGAVPRPSRAPAPEAVKAVGK